MELSPSALLSPPPLWNPRTPTMIQQAAQPFRRFAWLTIIGFAGLLVSGCGSGDSYQIVPVSGRVTLDGQPVSGARVLFEPVGEGDELDLGPGSFGKTDAEGRYTLDTVDRRPGALVGEHQVMISTFEMAPDLTKMDTVRKEEIPARYNAESDLTFDVSAEGTDAADFELTTTP